MGKDQIQPSFEQTGGGKNLSRRDFLRTLGGAGFALLLGRAGTAFAQEGRPTPTTPVDKAQGVALQSTEVAETLIPNRYPLQELSGIPENHALFAQLTSIEVDSVSVANGSFEIHIIGVSRFKNASGEYVSVALVLAANLPLENKSFITGMGIFDGTFENSAFEVAGQQMPMKSGDNVSAIFSASPNAQGTQFKEVLNNAISALYSNGELDAFIQSGNIDILPTIVFNGETYPLLLSTEVQVI